MKELTNEALDRMLHQETAKKEDLTTILRGIYTRYMRLYERYFANIDALNNSTVAQMRQYHADTQSLIKVYYMDIPLDICTRLVEFEQQCGSCLLGPNWHAYLWKAYADFEEANADKYPGEAALKAQFASQALKAFYDAMGYVFREGFGTESQTARNMLSGITELLFGKEK